MPGALLSEINRRPCWFHFFIFCIQKFTKDGLYHTLYIEWIAYLHPLLYCVITYQVFEAAGFEQDLPWNEIKGTLRDHVFQFTYTLELLGGSTLKRQILKLPANASIFVGWKCEEKRPREWHEGMFPTFSFFLSPAIHIASIRIANTRYPLQCGCFLPYGGGSVPRGYSIHVIDIKDATVSVHSRLPSFWKKLLHFYTLRFHSMVMAASERRGRVSHCNDTTSYTLWQYAEIALLSLRRSISQCASLWGARPIQKVTNAMGRLCLFNDGIRNWQLDALRLNKVP